MLNNRTRLNPLPHRDERIVDHGFSITNAERAGEQKEPCPVLAQNPLELVRLTSLHHL